MRTVHETEALRPSDPIPKSMQPMIKNRLKLSAKPQETQNGVPHPLNGVTNGNDPPGWTSSYPVELGFTAEEEARGPKELYRLLRRQIHWAEEEGELLKRQCEQVEELRKKEWMDKEVLLDQVIRNEVSWNERRQEVLRMLKQDEKPDENQESELHYLRRIAPTPEIKSIQGSDSASISIPLHMPRRSNSFQTGLVLIDAFSVPVLFCSDGCFIKNNANSIKAKASLVSSPPPTEGSSPKKPADEAATVLATSTQA